MKRGLLLLVLFSGLVMFHGSNGTTQGWVDTDNGTIMLHGPDGTIQGLINPDGTVMLHSNEGTTIGNVPNAYIPVPESNSFKQFKQDLLN